MEHMDFSQQELEKQRALVNHNISHPNGSPSHASWAEEKKLHVAVAYSNPRRWKRRLELFNDFRRHMNGLPNIVLHVGELAFGERPFEVTSSNHPTDVQLRTSEELWHKENILNVVIARSFPTNWQYGCYVDGDFHFTRHDIGLETIHQLQHYAWVQMFSSYMDISSNHEPLRVQASFANRYVKGTLFENNKELIHCYGKDLINNKQKGIGATGGAWAFRRESFNACGGLLDTCILGSGDWHMAFGLIGEPDSHPQTKELVDCGHQYANSIKIWQTRAAKAVRQNVGCVDCLGIHNWHGSKQNRGYGTRWKILKDCDYNPYVDVFKDHQGVLQLTQNKPLLRSEIRRYFNSRSEDDLSLKSGDNSLLV